MYSKLIWLENGAAIRVEEMTFRGKSGIDLRELYVNKDGDLKETRSGLRIYDNETGVIDGEQMSLAEAFFVAMAELEAARRGEGDDDD